LAEPSLVARGKARQPGRIAEARRRWRRFPRGCDEPRRLQPRLLHRPYLGRGRLLGRGPSRAAGQRRLRNQCHPGGRTSHDELTSFCAASSKRALTHGCALGLGADLSVPPLFRQSRRLVRGFLDPRRQLPRKPGPQHRQHRYVVAHQAGSIAELPGKTAYLGSSGQFGWKRCHCSGWRRMSCSKHVASS
jgi:hypothetical protein